MKNQLSNPAWGGMLFLVGFILLVILPATNSFKEYSIGQWIAVGCVVIGILHITLIFVAKIIWTSRHNKK